MYLLFVDANFFVYCTCQTLINRSMEIEHHIHTKTPKHIIVRYYRLLKNMTFSYASFKEIYNGDALSKTYVGVWNIKYKNK